MAQAIHTLLEVRRLEESARKGELARAQDRTSLARAAVAHALETLADRRLSQRTGRAREASERVATVEARLNARRWDARQRQAIEAALSRVRAAEDALAAAEGAEQRAREALGAAYAAREALERHVERTELEERRDEERRRERRS